MVLVLSLTTEFNQNRINYIFVFKNWWAAIVCVTMSHCSHHVWFCHFQLVTQTIVATNKAITSVTNNNITSVIHIVGISIISNCITDSLFCKLLSLIETMSIYLLNYSNCYRSNCNYRAFIWCLAEILGDRKLWGWCVRVCAIDRWNNDKSLWSIEIMTF